MGRSRAAWACSAVAPWGIALGLLVSITAQADQDPGLGGKRAQCAAQPFDVKSPYPTSAAAGSGADPVLIPAHFTTGDAADLSAIPDEIEPNNAVKTSRARFPAINRARKGDPFIGLRPGLDARLHRPAPLRSRAADRERIGRRSRAAPPRLAPAGPVGNSPVLPFSDGATPAMPLAIRAQFFDAAAERRATAGRPGEARGADDRRGEDRRRRQAELRFADRSQGFGAPDAVPRRGGLFRVAQRAGERPGRGGASRAQPRSQRHFPDRRLRRRLSGSQPPLRLPVLVRLRGQIAAHRRARRLGGGDADREGSRQRRQFQPEGRRGAELPRQLRRCRSGRPRCAASTGSARISSTPCGPARTGRRAPSTAAAIAAGGRRGHGGARLRSAWRADPQPSALAAGV